MREEFVLGFDVAVGELSYSWGVDCRRARTLDRKPQHKTQRMPGTPAILLMKENEVRRPNKLIEEESVRETAGLWGRRVNRLSIHEGRGYKKGKIKSYQQRAINPPDKEATHLSVDIMRLGGAKGAVNS